MKHPWASLREIARVLATVRGSVSYALMAIFQGLYFFLGGLWPIVSPTTFLAITGPKTDLWLVNTTGWLLAAIGFVLIVAGVRWRVAPELVLLAVGSAAALAGVEFYYVAKGVISPVYLLDAVIEVFLISLWLSLCLRGRGGSECGALRGPMQSKH